MTDRQKRSLSGRTTNNGSWRKTSALIIASLIAALMTFVLLSANLPNLRSHRLKFEDYGSAVESTRWFKPSARDWLVEGWRFTTVNYPELGPGGLVKPCTNLSIYLDSLIAPSPHSPWMFLSNYLGHAICVALVYFLSLGLVGLRKRDAIIAAVLFGGTLSTHELFEGMSFRGDMLAGLFCVLALLSLEMFFRRRSKAFVILCITALTFAVLSKEIALAGPILAGMYVVLRPWLLQLREDPPGLGVIAERIRQHIILLCLMGIPLAIFACVRLIVFKGGTLESVGVEVGGPLLTMVVRVIRFGTSAIFPVDRETLKNLVLGIEQPWWVTTRTLLAPVVNLAVCCGALVAGYRRQPRVVAWFLLGLAAATIPLLFALRIRYLYFSQMILVPASLLMLRESRFRWWTSPRQREVIGVFAVVTALAIGPAYTVARLVELQPEMVEGNLLSRAYESAIVNVLEDPETKRIFLINDPSLGGGRQKLRFHTLLSGRDDVTLRMVNRLEGHDARATGTGEGVFFDELEGCSLKVRIRCGDGEAFFGALIKSEVLRLGVPGLIRYGSFQRFRRSLSGAERLADREFTFFIPDACRHDFAVIGLDPASEGIHQYGGGAAEWVSIESTLSAK